MATQHTQVMSALEALAVSSTRTNTLLEQLIEKLGTQVTQAPAKTAGKSKEKAVTQAKAGKAAPKEKSLTREEKAHKVLAESVRVAGGKLTPPEGKVAWAEERGEGVFIFARTLEMAARALGTLPKGLTVKKFSTHAYKQTSTWWVETGSLAQAQDFAKKVK